MQLLFVAARQLEALDQGLKAAQVKEKYGTLRFYLDAYTPESEAIIEQAEKRSAETCEVCGNFGELRAVRGWYTTRCDECGL